jgi:hypothetical protein
MSPALLLAVRVASAVAGGILASGMAPPGLTSASGVVGDPGPSSPACGPALGAAGFIAGPLPGGRVQPTSAYLPFPLAALIAVTSFRADGVAASGWALGIDPRAAQCFAAASAVAFCLPFVCTCIVYRKGLGCVDFFLGMH